MAITEQFKLNFKESKAFVNKHLKQINKERFT